MIPTQPILIIKRAWVAKIVIKGLYAGSMYQDAGPNAKAIAAARVIRIIRNLVHHLINDRS